MELFKLEEYLSKYEFSAKYLFSSSDAESFGLLEILDWASAQDKSLWDRLRLGYTEVSGSPCLREAITAALYPGLHPDQILTFAGAEEGIFCALSALIKPGDHVIVLTPCYQSLSEIPKSRGASLTKIILREEHEWRIDLDAIKNNIKCDTKCIVINYPHNPTGQVIDEDDLKSLIEICDKQGIWLFSDEVYRLLGSPSKGWAPTAACLYDKAISLGVMSKAFGLSGLRVGWIACQDQKLLNEIRQVKHYTSICNSAPAEVLSLIALHNKDGILTRNNGILSRNLRIIDEFMLEYADLFEWVRPEGGCVGFVKYKGKGTVEAFCEGLIDKKSVLLIPGSIYEHTGNYFRIGLGRFNMPICVDLLKEYLHDESHRIR